MMLYAGVLDVHAGVLVLEEYEHAKARGAKIYADWVGGAFSCDAHHMTEPHPDGRGANCIAQRRGLSAQNTEDESDGRVYVVVGRWKTRKPCEGQPNGMRVCKQEGVCSICSTGVNC